ncbi:4Fe-4S dicluster domain [Carpediemonas membranifera]|uniref:4Fe-4S dicluster domain n=1 Tax=Carpediemonas membranifera TaxID=201153 RepID=A0A8J6AT31_9EUKA|nr:4Fe-4S dicluster domain [Carpediemonas membranifera]|eukprot:KAG9393388.1 4Fe-4S dicluster domain [Carpediemonas membranifera]
MSVESAALVYFSPTGTTKAVLSKIGEGLASKLHHIDITTEDRENIVVDDSLAIIGIPVYAGRIPPVAVQRLKRLSGTCPCVCVAVYGNREVDDALLELKNLVTERGFKMIAAGSFIGQHSFNTAERPLADGRPDSSDDALAVNFGEGIAAKLARNDLSEPAVPGNFPYKPNGPSLGGAPVTVADSCDLCGECEASCPTHAIKITDGVVVTQPDECIGCFACVQACPTDARVFPATERLEKVRQWLFDTCKARKEPVTYI